MVLPTTLLIVVNHLAARFQCASGGSLLKDHDANLLQFITALVLQNESPFNNGNPIAFPLQRLLR